MITNIATEIRMLILYLILVLIIATSWVLNAYQLYKCDFSAPYKGEVVHVIGLFFPTHVVTGWTNWDEPETNEHNE